MIQLQNPNQNIENSAEVGRAARMRGGSGQAGLHLAHPLLHAAAPNRGPGPPPRNQLPPAERELCSARGQLRSLHKVRIRTQNPRAWQGCSSAPTGLVAPRFPEVVTEKEMRGACEPHSRTHSPGPGHRRQDMRPPPAPAQSCPVPPPTLNKASDEPAGRGWARGPVTSPGPPRSPIQPAAQPTTLAAVLGRPPKPPRSS